MVRIATAAVVALMLAATPAAAQVEPTPSPTPTPEPTPEATAPCEESEEYATLGLEGAEEEVSPSVVPAVGHDITEEPYREESVVRYRYRLDVSGSEEVPTATSGDVRFNLMWGNDGDFDMYVYDAEGALLGESVTFNPANGAGESIQISQVDHCADLTVDIVNYLAPPTLDMTLTTTIGRVR